MKIEASRRVASDGGREVVDFLNSSRAIRAKPGLKISESLGYRRPRRLDQDLVRGRELQQLEFR